MWRGGRIRRGTDAERAIAATAWRPGIHARPAVAATPPGMDAGRNGPKDAAAGGP